MKAKVKYIIEKQNTSTATESEYPNDYDEYYSDTENTENTTTTTITTVQQGGKVAYKSLIQSNYKKPINGSRQDNFTRDDILKRLENCVPLKSIEDKRILEQLPVFKTWIKYYNTTTRQFRTGGLLMKVMFPDYIMLVNTAQNITWSVQLKDNIIYIPDQTIIKQTQKQKQQADRKQAMKEEMIKEKLYDMYKRGKLAAKK
jgi:hypothetical protein